MGATKCTGPPHSSLSSLKPYNWSDLAGDGGGGGGDVGGGGTREQGGGQGGGRGRSAPKGAPVPSTELPYKLRGGRRLYKMWRP